ncbi:MAG: hypothetical protein H0U76_04060 [Ktedonobacteraceae bacterium]|nr:hypothetical protein [Ktedonobacteraceae bacterium]
MEQPLPFLRPHPESRPEAQWEHIYRYFVEAEEKHVVLTSMKIQQVFLTETGETRDITTVRRYMYRYWRWFLFCVNDKVRPYQYVCQGIKNYPLDYFVQAHALHHMEFFAHFVSSMNAYKEVQERKELRRQATERQPKKSRQEEAPVQIPLDMDEPGEIKVDDHEEEEDPIQELDPGGVDSASQEMPTNGDVVEPPVDSSLLPVATPDPEPSPPPLSPPGPTSIPPLLIAGMIVVACVLVAAYFFFIKHP